MRSTFSLILLLTGLLLAVPATSHAQRRQGRRPNIKSRQSTASRQPHRSTVADGQAGGDEQQVMARVRGYQLQLEREEKLLTQRLAYAAQLRQKGLEKKDQNLLDQAEKHERKALAAYQGRVQQYEKAKLNPGAGGRAPKGVKNSKGVNNSPSTTRSQTHRRSKRSRTPISTKSAWELLR